MLTLSNKAPTPIVGVNLVVGPDKKYLPIRSGQLVSISNHEGGSVEGFVKVLLYPNDQVTLVFYENIRDYLNDPRLTKFFFEYYQDHLLSDYMRGVIAQFELTTVVQVRN